MMLTCYILVRVSTCFSYTDLAAEQPEHLFQNIWQSLVFRQKLVKGHGKGSMLQREKKAIDAHFFY